jgi:hypothetical protein
MTGAQLISLVRELVFDKATPYLWSDEVILVHLRKGEEDFCRRTHALLRYDESVTTVANQSQYDLNNRLLQVYAIRLDGEENLLPPIRGAAYSAVMGSTITATPRTYKPVSPRKIALYPTPDDAYDVYYVGAYLPDYDLETYSDPSIDEDHHEALAWYAAFRCLSSNDADGGSIGTAEMLKVDWNQYILGVKRETYRYLNDTKLLLQNWTGKRNGRT